jgi:NAD(P)-dependent dehydrogenase (short-subunit alcohol dehydrogenase family)
VDLGLRDRVAIVTGASRGLGRAIAATLAAEGCRLVICARGEPALVEAAAAMAGDDVARVLPVALDITESGSARRLVDATLERFGALDIVVSNAGGNRRKPFRVGASSSSLTSSPGSDWPARRFLPSKPGAAAPSRSSHRCTAGRRAGKDSRSTTPPSPPWSPPPGSWRWSWRRVASA